MTPRIATFHPFLSESEFSELKAEIAAAAFAPRGADPTDAGEAWLHDPGQWAKSMDAAAASYAETCFGRKADEKTSVLCTRYETGQFCPEHTDHYIRNGSSVMHRTASAILCAHPADAGGELVISNPAKTSTFEIFLQENQLVLFPADCWHQVLPVIKGQRRAIVRWYADSNGKRFRSE